MKILVTKTSDLDYKEPRDCENLEECINDILEHENFLGDYPRVVVSRLRDYEKESWLDCEYIVEIYDDYRE